MRVAQCKASSCKIQLNTMQSASILFQVVSLRMHLMGSGLEKLGLSQIEYEGFFLKCCQIIYF